MALAKFKNVILFILLPICMTTIGEFILKFFVNQQTQAAGDAFFVMNFNTLMVVLSSLFIFLGAILWLVAMSKYELSFLYPFLSINYAGIVIGSQFVLKEEVNIYRYLSIILIVTGLIFISRSPYSRKEEPKGMSEND